MARALAGFGVLLTAMVLAREVSVAFGGNETTLALGLAVWACALALGIRRPARRPGAWRHPAPLAALSAPLLLAVARGLDPLLGSWIGGDPQLGRLLLGTLLVLGPAGLLAGALLGRLATSAPGSPRPPSLPSTLRPGILAGAAAGSVAASLLPGLGLPTTLAVALAAASLLGAGASRQDRLPRPVLLPGLLLLALLTAFCGPLDRLMIRWAHPDLVAMAETPHGRLVLDRSGDVLVAHRDGARLQDSDPRSGAELAHLTATQRDRHDQVLVLGGWIEDLPAQLAPYAPDTVVTLVPEPALRRLGERVLADRPPPHQVIGGDPRPWLRAARQRFDLVLCALPDPVTVAAERFWTAQFFALCAERLRDGGVLGARLRTPEAVWTPRQARRVAAIRKGLQESFAHVQVLPGVTTVILAAHRPLDRDPERMAGRLRTGPATPDLVGAEWLRWRWQAERTRQTGALLEASGVTASSDLRPASTADALLRDLGRLRPGLGWRAAPRPGTWLGPLVIGGAVAMLVVRRRRSVSLAAVSGFAGLAGAMLAVVLLMHLQVRGGTLARDLGWLVAILVAGRGAAPWLLPRREAVVGRWRMPGLLVLLSVGSFLITLGLFAGLPHVAVALALGATGAVTAAVARAAATCPAARPGRLVAAELGGAALGTVIAALLLIPFSGLPATALTVAALAFPAAVTVWPLPGRPGPTADI